MCACVCLCVVFFCKEIVLVEHKYNREKSAEKVEVY